MSRPIQEDDEPPQKSQKPSPVTGEFFKTLITANSYPNLKRNFSRAMKKKKKKKMRNAVAVNFEFNIRKTSLQSS